MDWQKLIPRFWMQTRPTDLEWDAQLNAALDYFPVTDLSEHTCRVGPFEVWTRNWPYAYGRLYSLNGKYSNSGVPLVRTRKRLRKAIELIHTQRQQQQQAERWEALERTRTKEPQQ